MSFDRERPYGEVFGSYRGAQYVQDGVYYNGAGVEVGRDENAAPAVARVKAPAKTPVVVKKVIGAKGPQSEVIAENLRALAAEGTNE